MPARVLESMSALAEFLVSEARTLEGGSEKARKEVRDQIPSDRIKDAPAMARELRWRLRLAAGYPSDDEGSQGVRKMNKRKRGSSSVGSQDRFTPFKHFKPKAWDSVTELKAMEETKPERRRRPEDGENWVEQWTEERMGGADGSEDAEVRRRRDVVVKVRKTAKGVEKQQIERIVEEWTWT